MKCDIIRDLLPLYADGLLSDASREMIETHILQCDACRELLENMCAPVEQAPHNDEQLLIQGLKRQKRRTRNRLILACAVTTLVCLLSWWVYMETHFVMTQSVVVETNAERLFKERPELALTAAENALADSILGSPEVKEHLGSGDTVVIPPHQISEEVKQILPEDAELTEVAVLFGTHVTIDYRRSDIRTIIEYLDPNGDGVVDMIRKTIGVRRSPDTWEADTIYTVEYVTALDKAWYEKNESRHVWFGFLKMP